MKSFYLNIQPHFLRHGVLPLAFFLCAITLAACGSNEAGTKKQKENETLNLTRVSGRVRIKEEAPFLAVNINHEEKAEWRIEDTPSNREIFGPLENQTVWMEARLYPEESNSENTVNQYISFILRDVRVIRVEGDKEPLPVQYPVSFEDAKKRAERDKDGNSKNGKFKSTTQP